MFNKSLNPVAGEDFTRGKSIAATGLTLSFALKGINLVLNPYRDHWVGTARGAAICALIIVTLQLILFGTLYILRRHSETEPEHFSSLPAYAMKTWPLTLSLIAAGGLAGLLSSISHGMLRFSGALALITIPPGVVYAVRSGPMGFAPDSHPIALVAAVIGTSCALVLPRFAARLKSSNKSGTIP